jgi:site-specific DNA recombinase
MAETRKNVMVGIYVRVSSESQAEKASPEIQERDAREYCKQHGYKVVDVYKDTSAYRVKGRLTQPSGTRLDRPQFQRLLHDAKNGRINMIVAWKEDRLYRGLRPMLDVLDLLDELKGKLALELVKETFDMTMAPIKAAIARMELNTKNDRWHMGMRGRLQDGKVTGYNLYGYDYDKLTGKYTKNKEEAKWVYWMFRWYGEGCSVAQIHESLIVSGVQQKSKGKHASKTVWSSAVIRKLLSRDCYYTGKATMTLGEEVYTYPVPVILDKETYDLVLERRRRWEHHKTPHKTHEYSTCWLDGIIYCAAHSDRRMTPAFYDDSKKLVRYQESYRCQHSTVHFETSADCAGRVAMSWLDRHVWDRLKDFIGDPDVFESRLLERVGQLQKEQDSAQKDIDDLSGRLEAVQGERQRILTLFRKDHITEKEVDQQMELISLEEDELAEEIRKAGNIHAAELDQIVDLIKLYRVKVAHGIDVLGTEPTHPELFDDWTKAVRTIIRALVARVEVDANWNVSIVTHIDLKNPIKNEGFTPNGGKSGRKVGRKLVADREHLSRGRLQSRNPI